jgi:trimeric autotransporter adhesin
MKIITKQTALVLFGLLLTNYVSKGQTGNYFAGFQSGSGNTGSYNAFVGYQSGVNANTGWYNTFLGYQTGFLNKGGSYNVFIGSFAGYDNSSGLSNTFVGWASGSNNTTASGNSFYGNLSGYQTTTGANNAFFGSAAAYNNTTGANNAFIGNRSGYNNTTASNNTFLGYSSGEKNSTGALNTFIGSRTGYANTTGYENTVVGTEGGIENTTGYRNSFFGIRAGEKNTTGRENTFLGRNAGRNNVTGHQNTALGMYAGPSRSSLTNSTAIGSRAYVRVSDAVVIGSVSGENGATATAKVGIGTTSPAYLLHVNGVAAKPGGGSWTVASDKKLKKDIQPFQDGLKEIEQIKPVWFRYNGKAGLPTDKKFVGVIAQEMQKIAPHTIGEFSYETEDGQSETYLDYDANALTYILVNAVKELNTLAQQQTQEIKRLQEEIAILKQGGAQHRNPEGSTARLYQNFPNPYATSTVIKYFVPEKISAAQLRVISATGQEVFFSELMGRGEGEIEISSQILSAGSYVYQLIIDGTVVDNKKMVLSK